ncbi:hypothetical protein Heshes_18760 [Alicyclobacillus hesperidum]|uniref:ComK protein n=1 Tax=Alicyclobacillus hesperidum TaxID=89784 RepID=A0A1H2XB94_9BACL|nr:hypothetical protein [Alicyclobacillus hesperidum]GLV14192.1 hypothetical protein Heshes_18760 [Alicyclobacillus hesperidum]SDW90192.1 hypothetical protein SAMN04489725_11952 [Alicyclobacillus hesperidum]
MRTNVDHATAHPVADATVFGRDDAPGIAQLAEDLLAFIPVYYNGNRTLVVTSQGIFYLPWRCQWVKTNVLQHFAISQRDLRRACEQDLNLSLFTPLVITSAKVVYAPMKVREPISRNDGAHGYFRIDAIRSADSISPSATRLGIGDIASIDILMPRPKVLTRVHEARSSLILQEARNVPYPSL